MNYFYKVSSVLAFAAALANPCYAQQQAAPPLTIDKVKDNLYNIVGSGGNVGALVTDDGVVLIDDKFEQNYEGIMAR